MPAAIEKLMAHRAEFVAFLRNRGASAAHAEDVLQSALVRGLEPWAVLPPEDSLVPWFYRVLGNALIDQARRAATAAKAMERFAQEPLDAEPAADARRVCTCTVRLLPSLKPEYATMIERIDIEGHALDQVARDSGITPNNAYVRLHRARKALRDRLEAFCGSCATGGGRCADCYCHAEDRL
jgi:RNA polymerase sigma-70 factor (ECF subfamily)